MIVPDHRSSAIPRAPMRRKQRSRLNLERPSRLSRNIRACLGRLDPAISPEQEPAHLAVRRIFRLG
jgi:hypothetical protein